MATRRRGGDDPAWNEPGIGGDPDKPRRPPGTRSNHGVTSRLGEAFWREMADQPLTIPRWSNKVKMNANIKHLLSSYEPEVIEASFRFFRGQVDSMVVNDSLWDLYFRRRAPFLRDATRATEGRRSGQAVRTAGDIVVDNDRFQVQRPEDAPRTVVGREDDETMS